MPPKNSPYKKQASAQLDQRAAQSMRVDLLPDEAHAISMLALVVAAIVITWAAPTPSAEAAFRVTRPSTGACGDLEKADNGQLKIVQDENSQEVVPKQELGTLRLVARCP